MGLVFLQVKVESIKTVVHVNKHNLHVCILRFMFMSPAGSVLRVDSRAAPALRASPRAAAGTAVPCSPRSRGSKVILWCSACLSPLGAGDASPPPAALEPWRASVPEVRERPAVPVSPMTSGEPLPPRDDPVLRVRDPVPRRGSPGSRRCGHEILLRFYKSLRP